jgi:uncharacterized protein (TIGR02996 family)
MSEEESLLEGIYSAPDDDAPRLVYADWLIDHGRPERAELIRLQCQMAASENPADADRAEELIDRYEAEWTAHLPRSEWVNWRFRRGFPEELEIEMVHFLDDYLRWAQMQRVRYLSLIGTTAYLVREFASRRWNPNWIGLRFYEEPKPWLHEQPHESCSGVRAVVLNPQAALLRELWFCGYGLGEGGIQALCQSPFLDDLLVLGVESYVQDGIDQRLVERFGKRIRRQM